MISPFFVGLIADRFFATEKVLAALHLLGAVLLYCVTQVTSFGAVYALMLAYCLCYFPTIALTNSLWRCSNMKDAGSEFPLIRVFATIGWIVIGCDHRQAWESRSQRDASSCWPPALRW